MSDNLKNFVEEAKKVSDYYWTFAEEQDKVEGPNSIIGMEFWDGGDDIDYINSAILGFKEYGEVCKNKEDYFENLLNSKALTDNSQGDWASKLNRLVELFGKLSEGEIKNLWKEFPDYFEEDPDSWEDGEEDAEEAVGQSGEVTPEIEKAAYDWVDKQFAEDSDLYDEDYNFNFEEYDKRKETSGYPIDLLNWIDDCLQQMDDIGYEYEVFTSLFGHYPGEGNWTPGENDYGEDEIEEYKADEDFEPGDDIEKEMFEALSGKSATESNSSIKGKDKILDLIEQTLNEDPQYEAIKTPNGITVRKGDDEISFGVGVELVPQFKITDNVGEVILQGFGKEDLAIEAIKAIKEYLK